MRKILIFVSVVFFAFCSCKKESTTNLPGNLQTLSTSTVSASGIMTEPLGVNLTGFQLLDMCSSEICPIISGTAVFYIAPDGAFKPLCVYNLVFRNRNNTLCRGEYCVDLEPFTLFGEVRNTYKLVLSPRGVSSNKVLLALVQVNFEENGMYIIRIESGAIKCH